MRIEITVIGRRITGVNELFDLQSDPERTFDHPVADARLPNIRPRT
jgi:hypothetical protein